MKKAPESNTARATLREDAAADATGMVLVGKKGRRYQYKDRIGNGHSLTAEQRQRVAQWRVLLLDLEPQPSFIPVKWCARAPLCRANGHVISKWLVKVVDDKTRRQVATRLGATAVPPMNAAARRERRAYWYVKLAMATRDWTKLPHINGMMIRKERKTK